LGYNTCNTWKCHKETPCLTSKNVIFFLFTKSEKRREKQVLLEGRGRVGISRREKDMGRGCERVNIVQTLCTHVCKWKN
jgi:hypothetical protein